MCLTYLTTSKKIESEGNGYKIFFKTTRGNLKSSYFHKATILPTEKWINEKDFRIPPYKDKEEITASSGYSYPMGFHIYKNIKRAINHSYSQFRGVVVPVKFRKAHTRGKQCGLNVVVAKEIFIQKSGQR